MLNRSVPASDDVPRPTDARGLAATYVERGNDATGWWLERGPHGEVFQTRKTVRFGDSAGFPLHVRHTSDTLVIDTDTRAIAATVAVLVSERALETGRRRDVSAQSGGVEPDGWRRMRTFLRDDDHAWLVWAYRELVAAHGPKVVRFGWVPSRSIGDVSVKEDSLAPDGHLYMLRGGGEPERISLKEGRRRARRSRSAAVVSVAKAAGPEPEGDDSFAPSREFHAPGATVDAMTERLPDWARAALGEPSTGYAGGSEWLVCLGADIAGFTAEQLHGLLVAHPAGSHWVARHATVRTAAKKLESAHAWLVRNPARGHQVTSEAQDAARLMWDDVLGALHASGPVPANDLAYLAAMRAASVEQASTERWVLSDRDLAIDSALSRRGLRAVEERQTTVGVLKRGANAAQRSATTYGLNARDSFAPHVLPEYGAIRFGALCDKVVGYARSDLWAAPAQGASVLAPHHAVTLALVAQGVGTRERLCLVLKASDRTLRRWLDDLAALHLVTVEGGTAKVGLAPGVVAAERGVVGRAAERRGEDDHERAVVDTRAGFLAAGKWVEAEGVLRDERERAAARAGRPVGEPRTLPGSTEVGRVWLVDERFAIDVSLTVADERELDPALEALWDARWMGGGGRERLAVGGEVVSWRDARRAGTLTGWVPPAFVIRPSSDPDDELLDEVGVGLDEFDPDDEVVVA